MKRKLLILFLTVFTVIALLPMSALAADKYSIWVNGEQFTSDIAQIACGDGTAALDTSTSPYTLTLDNATITKTYIDGSSQGGIYTDVNLNIVVKGTCKIDFGANISGEGIYGDMGAENVTLGGDGTLAIKTNNIHLGILIRNGNLNIETLKGLDIDCGNNGIQAEVVTIKNSEVKVVCGGTGIVSTGYWKVLNLSDSKISVFSGSNCLQCQGNLYVSGCEIEAASDNGYGVYAGYGHIYCEMKFTDSVIDVSAKNEEVPALGGNETDVIFSGTGKAKIWNQSQYGNAAGDRTISSVKVEGSVSEVVFSGTTRVSEYIYDDAVYTKTGDGIFGITIKHKPALYIEKAREGTTGQEAYDPISGAADTARQLYKISPDYFDSAPEVKVQWKQADDSWGDTAPAQGLALSSDGKVTTTAATPAGSYTFRVTTVGIDPAVISESVTLTVAKPINIWVNGEVFSATRKTIACGEGTATLDTSGNPYVLTLDNATVTDFHQDGSYTGAIFADIDAKTGLNIVVKNTCAIRLASNRSSDGIYVNSSDLKISGDGTLDITLNNAGHQGIYGRYSDLTVAMDKGTLKIDCDGNGISAGDVTVSGTDLTIKSKNGLGIFGYNAGISNGKLSIESKDTGIYSTISGIRISNCDLSVKSSGTGIESHLSLTIGNCTTTVQAGDKCVITGSGSFTLEGTGSAELTTTGYYGVIVNGDYASMSLTGKVSPVTVNSNGSAVYAYPTRVSYDKAVYTVIGAPEQKSVTYTRKPMITVKKAKVGDPAADAPNPVYSTADNARQLYTFTAEFFTPEPTLKVEWKQTDGTWGDTAPATGLALSNDGKVTTSADTPAGKYVFRVTNGEPEKIEDPASETEPKAMMNNPAFRASGQQTLEVEKAFLLADMFLFNPPENPVYDGNNHPATVFVDGVRVGIGQFSISYLKDGISSDTAKDAGTYQVYVSAEEGENYKAAENLTKDNWIFTIAKAITGVTVTATAYEGFYDGQGHTVDIQVDKENAVITYSYEQNGEYKPLSSFTKLTDATEAPVTVYYKVEVPNYETVSGSQTVTIKPRPVTLVAGSASKVYDGTPLTEGGFTVKADAATAGYGFVGEEGVASVAMTEDSTVTLPGTVPNVIDTVTAKANTDLTKNYIVSKEPGTLTVTAAPMEVTATAYTADYDGESHNITWTVMDADENSVTPDAVYLRESGTSEWIAEADFPGYTDVCDKVIEVKAVKAGYADAVSIVAVQITPAAVKVTAVPVADKVYNGKTDGVSVISSDVILSGVIGSDELTVGGITGTYNSADAGNAQGVTLNSASEWTLGGAAKNNYVLAAEGQPTATTGKITRAALTVTAKDKTVGYSDAAANDGVTYSGFVNDETASVLGGTLVYAYKVKDTDTDYTVTSPVGTYDIIPGGLTSDNYEITFAKGTLTVVVKKLTKPTAVSKTYTYNAKEQTFAMEGFDAASMTVSGNKQTNVNESGYTVTVTPKQYFEWNTPGDCEFTWIIAKANPAYSVPEKLTAVYGSTLADVTLPEGFTWQDDAATAVGNVGESTFKVTYTPADTDNYNVVKDIEVKVAVTAAKLDKPTAVSKTYTYDGRTQRFKMEGFDKNTMTVSGNRQTAANETGYTVTVTPKDNYEWSTEGDCEFTWVIAKAVPAYIVPEGLRADYGDTLAKLELPTGFTWQVSTSASVGNVGKNTFKVTYTPQDTDNYKVVKDIEVKVAVSAKKLTKPVAVLKAYTYNGNEQTFAMTGFDAATMTVSGNKRTAANEAGYTVTVTPKANYEWSTDGDCAFTWVIAKAVPAYTVPENLTVTYGKTLADVTLPAGFTWQDETTAAVGNVGNNTFKVTYTPSDTANYNAVKDIEVKVAVTAKKLTKPTAVSKTYTYNGNEQTFAMTGFDAATMTVSGNKQTAANEAGYTVTVTPKANYEWSTAGDCRFTWVIGKAVPTYTAPENLTATYGDTLADITLPAGFTWQDDAATTVGNVGESTFKVTYTPSDTVNYSAVKDIEVKVAVSAAKLNKPAAVSKTYTYSGREQRFRMEGFDKNTMTVSGNRQTAANETGYTVTVTPKANYEWNTAGDCEFTWVIAKAVPAYTVPELLTASYGKTLADIELPTGFSWQDAPTTSVGNVGKNIFKVTYTPQDTANFNTVTDIDVAVKVTDKMLTKPVAVMKTYTYNGEEQTFAMTGFDEATMIVSGDKQTAANEAGYTVTVTPKANYEWSTDGDCAFTWVIAKAVPAYTVPADLQADYGDTLADVTLPEGFSWQDDAATSVGEAGVNTFKVTYTPADTVNCNIVKDIEVKVTVGEEIIHNYANCPKDKTCVIEKFTDTANNAWWHHGIHYCLENGLMTGTGDTTFAPKDDTTRAQIVTMLWRLEGKPAVDFAVTFPDVKAGAWYTEAVRWAAAEKIVSGYGNGCFGPNDSVTREQLMTVLYRYAQYKGIDVSVDADVDFSGFNDFEATSAYAQPAMMWAIDRGLILGDNGNLNPKGNTVRAQVAAFFQRFCENICK